MPEVSTAQAAEIIGTSDETIRRYVDRSMLPARQQGIRGIIRIELSDLRSFAEQNGFRYDQQIANRHASS